MLDLPDDFLNSVRPLLKEEYSSFLATYDFPAAKGIRLNPLKSPAADISEFFDGRVPYVENGFYTLRQDLGGLPYHRAGCYYMQEPSAMFPAAVLSPEKTDRVLDLCAAPGGKSGQLAEMATNGVIVSNEIMGDRCRILLGNVERMGYRNVVVTCLSPKEIADSLTGWFDKVLVDAPCSGEGMFRKNPEAIKEWSLSNVKACAERQADVLLQGGRCVKKGGKLVYSTCTFSKEENEDTVERFLKTGDFKLLKIDQNYGIEKGLDEFGYTARLYPHKLRGEGHFTALFERVTENQTVKDKTPLKDLDGKERREVERFIKESLTTDINVKVYNGNLVIPPEITPPITRGALCYGVKLGEIDNRLIPHHQFFSAYGGYFKRQVDLNIDDERLAKYLHGEEIDADKENGWCSVLLSGAAIGGGKIVDGKVKNKLPKGLRK